MIKATPNKELKPFHFSYVPSIVTATRTEFFTSFFYNFQGKSHYSSSLLHIEVKFLLPLSMDSSAIAILFWAILVSILL